MVRACLFTQDNCSLAVATWALTILGAMTLLAALAAAVFAGSAYFIEVRKLLGERVCHQKEHEGEAAINLYLRDNRKIGGRPPPGFDLSEYDAHNHAFINLSRSPIINVSVGYTLRFSDSSDPLSERIELGSVGRDDEIHLCLYRHRSLPSIERIDWADARQGRHGKQPLEFYPQFEPEKVRGESKLPKTDATGGAKV
jgi:hypothetical protein